MRWGQSIWAAKPQARMTSDQARKETVRRLGGRGGASSVLSLLPLQASGRTAVSTAERGTGRVHTRSMGMTHRGSPTTVRPSPVSSFASGRLRTVLGGFYSTQGSVRRLCTTSDVPAHPPAMSIRRHEPAVRWRTDSIPPVSRGARRSASAATRAAAQQDRTHESPPLQRPSSRAASSDFHPATPSGDSACLCRPLLRCAVARSRSLGPAATRIGGRRVIPHDAAAAQTLHLSQPRRIRAGRGTEQRRDGPALGSSAGHILSVHARKASIVLPIRSSLPDKSAQPQFPSVRFLGLWHPSPRCGLSARRPDSFHFPCPRRRRAGGGVSRRHFHPRNRRFCIRGDAPRLHVARRRHRSCNALAAWLRAKWLQRPPIC